MITQESLADDRYKQNSPLSKTVNVHPRDWVQTFGIDRPIIVSQFVNQLNQTIQHSLYPDYSQYDGWRWISKSTKDQKQQRMLYAEI